MCVCVLLRTGHQAEHFTVYLIVITACDVGFIILILLIKKAKIVEVKYHVQTYKREYAWGETSKPDGHGTWCLHPGLPELTWAPGLLCSLSDRIREALGQAGWCSGASSRCPAVIPWAKPLSSLGFCSLPLYPWPRQKSFSGMWALARQKYLKLKFCPILPSPCTRVTDTWPKRPWKLTILGLKNLSNVTCESRDLLKEHQNHKRIWL